MIVNFKYYLQDTYDTMERNSWISEQTGVLTAGELADKLNNPFYEIELDCELDTATGQITILRIMAE
mgnify:CR=1 FL=1